MKQSKETLEIAAVRALALADLANTSDDDLRKELLADGYDLQALSSQVRSKMDEVAGTAMRAKTSHAKQQANRAAQVQAINPLRPAIERMKELINDALNRQPDLAVAFRDGKKQSEADVQSLYDDLVQVGVIKPEDHGH